MAKKQGQKKPPTLEEGRLITTKQDFDNLVYFLLPQKERRKLDDPTKKLEKSATRTIMHLLWDNSNRSPQNIQKICRHISKNDEWDKSRMLPGNEPEDMQVLIKRLQRKMNRLKRKIEDSSWKEYAHVEYDELGAKYQLLIDPKEIEESRRLKDQKQLQIDIDTNEYVKGIPILRVGHVISFHFNSPIKGSLHMMHIDANGFPEKMFPARKGNRNKSVLFDEWMRWPEDFLKKKYRWRVGELPGTQRIAIAVTRLDVELKDVDWRKLGFDFRERGEAITWDEPSFDDLRPSDVVSCVAEYETRKARS